MSARDDLLHWVNEGLKEWGHDGSDDIQAEDLVDAFAHELAELQRLRMDELDLTGQKARIMGRIVDLIDPHLGAGAGVTGAREDLWDELGIDPDRISREEFDEYMDAYDQAASAGPVRPDEEPTP